MELRSGARVGLSPTRSLVGVAEVALAVAALVALRWSVAALGLSTQVHATLHRILFFAAVAIAAHQTMRRTGDFAWRTIGATAVVVAAAVAVLIVLSAAGWLPGLVAAVAVAGVALVGLRAGDARWTRTRATVAVLVAGLGLVFLAFDPGDGLALLTPAMEDASLAVPFGDPVPGVPLVAGAVLYAAGRAVA